jgi:hypothetical protein
MKVIGNQHTCRECNTTVEIERSDIETWNSIKAYRCPSCREWVHISGSRLDRILCPFSFCGKKSKEFRR